MKGGWSYLAPKRPFSAPRPGKLPGLAAMHGSQPNKCTAISWLHPSPSQLAQVAKQTRSINAMQMISNGKAYRRGLDGPIAFSSHIVLISKTYI